MRPLVQELHLLYELDCPVPDPVHPQLLPSSISHVTSILPRGVAEVYLSDASCL